MSKKPILVPKYGQYVIETTEKTVTGLKHFIFTKSTMSGLVSGVIEFLENPIARANPGASPNPETPWKKFEIGKLDSLVAVVAVDITRNGLMDLVICHDHGRFMLECDPHGSIVSWLENTGRERLEEGHWQERFIGRWPAMCQVKAGYFTQKCFSDRFSKSLLLRLCMNHMTRFEWHRDVIYDRSFTVIHEVTSRKFDGPNGLDSMLVASREGTTRLYFEDNVWKRDLVNIGEPKGPRPSASSEPPGSGDHWGTGCVAPGRSGMILLRISPRWTPSMWKRHVLDVYGTPNRLKHTGDGPGHYIVCANFDGDGDDEFLLALFGSLDRDKDGNSIDPNDEPNPNKGIIYYKAVDLEKGFNFAGNSRIDFASISYNVARYYVEPNPKATIHLNKFVPSVSATDITSTITLTVWVDEGLIYLPYPTSVHKHLSQPLIEVANYAIYIDVLPPIGTLSIQKQKEGIKVLYGSISDDKGRREPFSVAPFTKSLCTSQDGCITADQKTGSVALRLIPLCDDNKTWKEATDVPINTTFDVSKIGLKLEPLKFTKVDQLWWGKGDLFKGKDFYNMTGFSFRFQDQTPLAHLQFWTTGRLDEYGGMWKRDTYGKAQRTADGIVVYPYHKWQSGDTDGIDIWAAIEFNPYLNL
ncbi:hypothetical protein K440DRAFT_642294 [Wilcoxina mikolae CBS 423.85]|nr:hypothetical protein K440DRAFT_642294 [Wilcoxina mikolae CBS 423.85]